MGVAAFAVVVKQPVEEERDADEEDSEQPCAGGGHGARRVTISPTSDGEDQLKIELTTDDAAVARPDHADLSAPEAAVAPAPISQRPHCASAEGNALMAWLE